MAFALVVALIIPATGCGDGELVLTPEAEEFIEAQLAGLQGEQGVAGPQGSQGVAGAQGLQGEQGPAGAPGATGSAGEPGATGPAGEPGATGEAGAAGSPGASGAMGPQGLAGVFPAFSVQLQVKNSGQATITFDTITVATGTRSLHLTTLGTIGGGDEARIVLTPLQPMTLGEVLTIAWSEYLVSGYMPHVDIILDTDGDGVRDDALVIEYAYNVTPGATPPSYGATAGTWYQTFSDNGGPAVVDDTAYAWLTSGAPGPVGGTFGQWDHWGITLGQWKAGQSVTPATKGVGTFTIDANTLVTAIEIEVDNWIPAAWGGVQAEAYVDNITVNGVAVLPD